MAQISEIEKLDPRLHPIFSSPERYFEEMAATSHEWPIVAEELQHHARGCYTALSRIKRENRELEHQLMAAERLATLSSLLDGTPNEQLRLAEAWQNVLFNQFHDILAGTSIRAAYEDVWKTNQQARQICHDIRSAAQTAMQSDLEILQHDQPYIVWNTLPWARKQVVQFNVSMGGWQHDWRQLPGDPQVTDAAGNKVPSQLLGVEFDNNTYIAHIEALVDAPPLGARVVYLNIPSQETLPRAAAIPTSAISNEYWQLRFDSSGALVSLFDCKTQVELLAAPAGVPIVIDDPSDTWSHDITSFRNECGRFTAIQPPSCVHKGETRQTIQVHTSWGSSFVSLSYTLRPGQKAIELDLDIDWHEQLKMLKLAFPLAVRNPRVTSSAPYGSVRRSPNGEEEPCQAWIDLSGEGKPGEVGLGIITDSKYGYDALDNELRLSLLRSPIYAFHDPRKIIPGIKYHFTDQGEQMVHCLILPHIGALQMAALHRSSFELLEPLLAQAAEAHPGNSDTLSLLSVEPENILLSAVKLSEDGGQLLVRGVETKGSDSELIITSPAMHLKWATSVKAFEIFTLQLPLDGRPPIKLNLLEEAL